MIAPAPLPPARALLPLLLLFLLATHTDGHRQGHEHQHHRQLRQQQDAVTAAAASGGFEPPAGRAKCGTPDLTREQKRAFVKDLEAWESSVEAAAALDEDITVKVVWHMIMAANGTGKLTRKHISDQLTVINQAFLAANIRFVLQELKEIVNNDWFAADFDDFTPIMTATRVGDEMTLNIWSKELEASKLGVATFPMAFSSDPSVAQRDGMVLRFFTVPGNVTGRPRGFEDNADGITAVHEVGHWLGLLHTFDPTSCQANADTIDEYAGDLISDTPAEATPAFYCQIGRDTCTGPQFPGLDPVTNFMDYSDDNCLTQFSPQQNKRMRAVWSIYRQKKLGGYAGICYEAPPLVKKANSGVRVWGGACPLPAEPGQQCTGSCRLGWVPDPTPAAICKNGSWTTSGGCKFVGVDGAPCLVQKVSMSETHACALLESGEPRCWLSNAAGALGIGNTSRNSPLFLADPTAAMLGLTQRVQDLAAGSDYTLLLTSPAAAAAGGSVLMAGRLFAFNSTQQNVYAPVPVAGLSGNVLSIAAGGNQHACVVKTDGSAACFGTNQDGQLGNRGTTNSSTPVAVVGLQGASDNVKVQQVCVGQSSSCALYTNLTSNAVAVTCWGKKLDASRTSGSFWTVEGWAGQVQSISCGSIHVCGVVKTADNTSLAQCIGAEPFLGDDNGAGVGAWSSTPVTAKDLTGVKVLTGGHNTTCALLEGDDNNAACWGFGNADELGNLFATTQDDCQVAGSEDSVRCSPTPIKVDLFNVGPVQGTTVRQISYGYSRGCVLMKDRTVRCWGETYEKPSLIFSMETPVDFLECSCSGKAVPDIQVAAERPTLMTCANATNTTRLSFSFNYQVSLPAGSSVGLDKFRIEPVLDVTTLQASCNFTSTAVNTTGSSSARGRVIVQCGGPFLRYKTSVGVTLTLRATPVAPGQCGSSAAVPATTVITTVCCRNSNAFAGPPPGAKGAAAGSCFTNTNPLLDAQCKDKKNLLSGWSFKGPGSNIPLLAGARSCNTSNAVTIGNVISVTCSDKDKFIAFNISNNKDSDLRTMFFSNCKQPESAPKKSLRRAARLDTAEDDGSARRLQGLVSKGCNIFGLVNLQAPTLPAFYRPVVTVSGDLKLTSWRYNTTISGNCKCKDLNWAVFQTGAAPETALTC